MKGSMILQRRIVGSQNANRLLALVLFCIATTIAPCQTVSTLFSFDRTDGFYPRVGLFEGVDGSLYGTTAGGGANNYGSMFVITTSGQFKSLYDFCSLANCADGSSPNDVIQASDGNFYGTTDGVGSNSFGTVFKMTSSGTFTTIYSFCSLANCGDGKYPASGLVQGSDGSLYGTTQSGGTNNAGTVFKITPAGQLTTLYSFCSVSGCLDGAAPFSRLLQSPNGNFYGSTVTGGSHCGNTGVCGTIFRITPGGVLTTLYNFCSSANCDDGAAPYGALLQGPDGNFYGTTFSGGSTLCSSGCGTVFKVSSSGTLSTLYRFCEVTNCPDGYNPYGGLSLGTDGNFYGTTVNGGQFGKIKPGTIFKMTSAGQLTTFYSFCMNFGCPDGAFSYAPLLQDTNGKFYGTTTSGGVSNDGEIFSVGIGAAPFAITRPTFGKIGSKVLIVGNNLTGATSVTFNGTSASFTVLSATEIRATVPTGATTGKVQITTPARKLTSNVVFRVN